MTQRVKKAGDILRDVSLDLLPGQLTAIAGSSGAGKTVLLETLAGLRTPAQGVVLHDGSRPGPAGPEFGLVPQEDIIHRELPLGRTLRYAAGLRMAPGTPPAVVDEAVTAALGTLGLSRRTGVPVGSLSGGERKRASIAVELLTRPRVLFLDEPTSGLDPVTGADLMRTLRTLAGQGTTVLVTTHTPADLAVCDQVVFLSPHGTPAYTGPAAGLCAAFAVPSVEEVYGAVAAGARVAAEPLGELTRPETETRAAAPLVRLGAGTLRQWALLTRRGAETLLRNRLSVAVLVGSPVMIVAMFAVLFRAGAFDPRSPDPGSSAMILFWIAFGAFFFGLSDGLLQICTELPVLRRERLAGMRLGPYVASKLTVMLPVLAVADAVLLAVLRALDRLPTADWPTYGSLFVTSVLASAAALALGLLASAAVREPGQATLMLPLLCFPQVLFSGAFVPVPRMAWAGRAISWAMTPHELAGGS
ncbi:ATP-binding cassette domain-containing protein [Streptomyces sp. NPDC005336]|uniref:ATP-binding cassette domain-containing protein n=1 Tax=Streptomyces sp. NPDC005336 TaxID=3157035 RepID=UPI0033B18EE4